MRHILDDRKGVSNILGYLFSFGVASILMVSAVLITTGILNNKAAAVANIQAQSIANKVADAIVEAIAVGQPTSNAEYKKTLDLPTDIAGRGYYVDVTDTMVYVNTTDGIVSKSCSTYTAEDLKIGVGGGRIYCSAGKLNISVDKSDTLYKFDFGTGNLSKHSPVGSGYYFVSDKSKLDPIHPQNSLREPLWWNASYKYRVPILINNTSPEELVNVPIKIVLNTSNFDYSNAKVNFTSSSNVTSDLVFNDPSDNAVAKIEITPTEWEPSWFYTYYDPSLTIGTVDVRIKEISGGYNISYINVDTIKLNGNVRKKSWNAATGVASFNGKEALESLENGKHFLKSGYAVTVSGLLKNGIEFRGSSYISIKNALYVSQGDSIQTAIDNVSAGGTVFVYNGTYWEQEVYFPPGKKLNLIGESMNSTIFQSKSDNCFIITNTQYVNIESFWIYPKITTGELPADGILISGCNHINITNCKVNGTDDGIEIRDSYQVGISKCLTYGMVGAAGQQGIGIVVWKQSQDTRFVRITNCESKWQNTTYGNGIKLDDVTYVDIINCISHDNTGADSNGIQIAGSSYCNVKKCLCYNLTGSTAEGSGDGVQINNDAEGHTSQFNNIENCITWGNSGPGPIFYGSGISIKNFGTSNNFVNNCTIYENGVGIHFELTQANTVSNCNIYNNLKEGISILVSLGNIIKNCNSYNNGDSGIYVAGGCWFSLIQNCTVYGNGINTTGAGGFGILLQAALGTTIEYCNVYGNQEDDGTFLDNKGDGIRLMSGCTVNTIRFCNSFDNDDDGLQVGFVGGGACTVNSIQNCNFYCNVEGGAFFANTNIGNSIYNCNFDLNPTNAYDDCETLPNLNDWNLNYWDDLPSNPGRPDYEIRPYNTLPFYGTYDYNPRAAHCPDNPAFFQVKASYSENYYHKKSIQSAMANMPNAGGVILVYAGTYSSEQITINQPNVKLIGEGNVIVSGSSGNYVIKVNNLDVRIEGLTIRDGSRGIDYEYASSSGNRPLKITNCKIIYNTQYGIYLGGSINNYCIINNCSISNNPSGGIYIASNNNKIINCTIKDNVGTSSYGVYINSRSSNTFINCNLFNNRIGLYINSGSNNIINNSKILNHASYGIDILSSSNSNKISNCTISGNTGGIYIGGSSNSNKIRDSDINGGGLQIADSSLNIITYCNIHGNSNGVDIHGSSTYNEIINCSIFNNQNGVLTQTGTNNNKIYHNDFTNYGINAQDTGANNKWNDSYPSGGNLWDDYDEESDDAKDYLKGKYPQQTPGSDGIADLQYPGVPDKYPFCRKTPAIPYFIDYWNPYGDSVILVNMSIGALASKYILLYYGCNGTLNNFHKHNMNEISVFFDDFNSYNLLENQWKLPTLETPASSELLKNSCINLSDGVNKVNNITTKDFSIPNIGNPPKKALSSTTSESMYIVEAKMKIASGQGNIILLEFHAPPQPPYTDRSYYLISANLTPSNRLSLIKYNGVAEGGPPVITLYQLDNVSAPNLSHWIRMKSYVYLSKTYYPNPDNPSWYSQTNATFIKNYAYDFNTFAGLSSISGLDTWGYSSIGSWVGEPDGEAARGIPYPYPGYSGRIGLGCGLLSSQNSNILVDWIRVMKSPIVPPIVTIGSTESINYGWTAGSPKSWNANTSDPFKPGPVLCDFNYGKKDDGSATFAIENLTAGKYTITVTKGNYTNTSSVTYVTVGSQKLTIPSTQYGKFETKWFTINKETDNLHDLEIVFDTASGKKWTVNSLTIDRGVKGIKVGLE